MRRNVAASAEEESRVQNFNYQSINDAGDGIAGERWKVIY